MRKILKLCLLAVLYAGCAHAPVSAASPPSPRQACLANPPPAEVKLRILDERDGKVEDAEGQQHTVNMIVFSQDAGNEFYLYLAALKRYATQAWETCR